MPQPANMNFGRRFSCAVCSRARSSRDVVLGLRRAEQIALHFGAAFAAHMPELVRCLDAFGADGDAPMLALAVTARSGRAIK
jgi:hypothetical protein